MVFQFTDSNKCFPLTASPHLDHGVNEQRHYRCDDQLIGREEGLQLAQLSHPLFVYRKTSLFPCLSPLQGKQRSSSADGRLGLTLTRDNHRRCLKVYIAHLKSPAWNRRIASM